MLQKSLIFVAFVAIGSLCSVSCQLNLVSGRMGASQCNSTQALQKTPDFCALATNVDQMLSQITDPASVAVIQAAMTRLDVALKNESQIALTTLVMLNQPLIATFKKEDPQSYDKLMTLFNMAQQNAASSGSSTLDSTSVCDFYNQFQQIQSGLTDAGKQTLGTILCGIHQTIRQQIPKLFGQVISKQDFVSLITKNPQLMQQLGAQFQKFFTTSMN